MFYFENETIMSLANALDLKPNEISVLGHVRTYEYVDDELLPYFVEMKIIENVVVVRKNRILDFPLFELEEERKFPTTEAAIETFQQWINELRDQ
ncbi:hypothetical protein [Ammoniphilus sp. YIM 78166]|uniref:hypothetical protein n=1 Tax=Ammoniphilus sp. YIM 78166 TaxID=1644106 RepID=UPI00106F5C3A|nr:hypothetical protein [Ammoniphilus sp. YIM 78166]